MQKQSTYTVFGYERIELIKERESLNDMQCYNIATIIYLLVNDVLLVCVIWKDTSVQMIWEINIYLIKMSCVVKG